MRYVGGMPAILTPSEWLLDFRDDSVNYRHLRIPFVWLWIPWPLYRFRAILIGGEHSGRIAKGDLLSGFHSLCECFLRTEILRSVCHDLTLSIVITRRIIRNGDIPKNATKPCIGRRIELLLSYTECLWHSVVVDAPHHCSIVVLPILRALQNGNQRTDGIGRHALTNRVTVPRGNGRTILASHVCHDLTLS